MLNQGDKVSFNAGGLKGTGVVCGKASMEKPVVGADYIIQPDQSISSEVYPYSHISLPECHLTIIK